MGYEVDFLAVGEGEKSGDAIALRFGNLYGPRNQQQVVVIDGGFEESGSYLAQLIHHRYGTTDVDLVVCTHSDADHAGGLIPILQELRVGCLWMHQPWLHTIDIAKMFVNERVTDKGVSEALKKSLEDAKALETLAKRKGIPIVEPFTFTKDSTGQVVVLGPSRQYYDSLLPAFRGTPEADPGLSALLRAFEKAMEFIRKVPEALNIETLTDSGTTSAENNSSTILMLSVDGHSLIFTSDAGAPALAQALNVLDAAGFDYSSVRFVQVPHHGSHNNVGPTVLNRLLGPIRAQDAELRVAYVSASRDGAPRHPSKKVTNAFRRRGAPVYATQGINIWYKSNSPPRPDGVDIFPLPLYGEVEE